MHAPPKSDYPVLAPNDLGDFDAVLFGIPTRYGNFPAQWKVGISVYKEMKPSVKKTCPFSSAFWDATGQLWQHGKLHGKYAGVFVSTGGLGGGQESTAIAALSTLSHHGMIFVPLGYAPAFGQLTNLTEAHGGTYLCAALLLYRVGF